MNIEIQNSKTYELGEQVQFLDQDNQVKVGRLEDQNAEEGWFECFLYLTPEQTPQGRLSHHGKHELFKSNIWVRSEHSKIQRQVYVVKLKDYQKLKEEKNLEDVFMVRQDYDQKTQVFMPLLQKCLCGRFANPEETLVFCEQCEKPFCANCLKLALVKSVACDFCRTEIPASVINAKFELHKLAVGQQIAPPKKAVVVELKDDDEEEEEEFTKKRPALDFEKLAKKIKKNDLQAAQPIVRANEKLPVPVYMERQNSAPQKNKHFKNISQEKCDKINQWVEIYKTQETVIPHMPKKRLVLDLIQYQEVREKFHQLLWYGVEELRDLYDKNPADVSQAEKSLIQQTDQVLYQTLKKMVLEIEVSLHMKFNLQKSERLDNNYIERCKIVYMHMKDDKNLDLRRKVLTKDFTANDLCIKDERELYNPERRRETLEMTRLNFDLDKKVLENPKPTQMEEEPEIHSLTKNKNNHQNDTMHSKHINVDVYKFVKDYMLPNQLKRIQTRLKADLKPELADPLIEQLEDTYQQFANNHK